MKFEIINPSDPYTLEAEDLEVAAVALCVLCGSCALKGIEDNEGVDVPAFDIPGLPGPDEWFKEHFGVDFEASTERVLDQRAVALVAAFDSVKLHGVDEPSSLNDISADARELAERVRSRYVFKESVNYQEDDR